MIKLEECDRFIHAAGDLARSIAHINPFGGQPVGVFEKLPEETRALNLLCGTSTATSYIRLGCRIKDRSLLNEEEQETAILTLDLAPENENQGIYPPFSLPSQATQQADLVEEDLGGRYRILFVTNAQAIVCTIL